MARGLADQFFRRVESLALSTLPTRNLTAGTEASKYHDSVMIALVPDSPDDLAVEGDGALTADDLHITLCYLGKVQNLSSFDKTRILSDTRRVVDKIGRPFSTTTDGVIVMGQNDDGVPATALLVQSEDIVNLYDALAEALNYQSTYPSFIPHMTAGYGVPVDVAQEKVGQQVDFDKIIVKFGEDIHVIPLTAAITAAPRSVNILDRVIDSLGRMWDEALHPRGDDGRFIKKNGAISGKLAVPSTNRKGVEMVDANRASVVGFHTFDDEVWVLAEIKNPDGTTQQGFARATDIHAVAPVKARLDALYPVDDMGDAFINSSLERKRQLDLILAKITSDYGADNDEDGAFKFLESLGLWEKDLDYVMGNDTDIDFLGGIRRVDRDLSDGELDEQEDIIEDARQVKSLRDRVHGLKDSAEGSNIKSLDELMSKYEELGVDSFVSEKDGSITLSKVVVGDKSQGTGSAFMQDLVGYADSVDKRIDLTPSSDFGGSKSRLVDFYKRFGFIENKGKNKDYEVSETMYRLPEASTAAPALEPHVQPAQILLSKDAPDPEVVAALRSGADPFSLQTSNLLGAMVESDRFDIEVPSVATGISPIHWLVDPGDNTGNDVKLAGTGMSTTDRAYFVKKSVIGAEFHNTDIVNEVTASLMAESVAAIVGEDDSRLLRIPKSVFGDNPEWDNQNPPGTGDVFDSFATHQPAHVVSQHAEYLIPSDWNTTAADVEEGSMRNAVRGVDLDSQADQMAAFYEDMGEAYGNSVAKMVLWDFVILNGDRNPGNAILATPPDGSEGVAIPIDHGFSFDEPFVVGDSKASFDWFINYPATRGWLNYIRGGLALNSNVVTEDSLRQATEEFTDAYSNITVEAILSKFRAIPGVTDEQIKRVEASLVGAVDRLEWMRNNMDAVLRALIGEK